jgi:hypothetical protein
VGDGADEVSGIHAVREAQVDLAGVVEGLYLVWGELQVQRETKMRRHRHEAGAGIGRRRNDSRARSARKLSKTHDV